MATSVISSLPQVANLQQVVSMAPAVTMATSNTLPPAQTLTTAEGVSIILVPTTMVPENTAIPVPIQATSILPNVTGLTQTSLPQTQAPVTSTQAGKPVSLQVSSTKSEAMTPARSPTVRSLKGGLSQDVNSPSRCKRRLDFASIGLHSLQRPAGSTRGSRR